VDVFLNLEIVHGASVEILRGANDAPLRMTGAALFGLGRELHLVRDSGYASDLFLRICYYSAEAEA
jgi:hypothetical protein